MRTAEHAAAQLRLRDDHLCRVGRRAVDAADLWHRTHRSQHVDGKESVAQEDQDDLVIGRLERLISEASA